MESQWMTTKEAAAYLGVSTSWLNQRRAAGKYPAWYKVGRLARYKKEDLDRWVNANRKEGQNG
jgi:excisionase family DNA binding protein